METLKADEEKEWEVHPCPGYVLKFKKASFRESIAEADKKLFLNICHCTDLPAPLDDYDEERVAEILNSSDPGKYRIPLSVGLIDFVLDKSEHDAMKIDIIVNSNFYFSRLEKSDFFRHLLLLMLTDAIHEKHKISINPQEAVQLKNRKVVGSISSQRIRRMPAKVCISEMSVNEPSTEAWDHLQEKRIPKNCQMILQNGNDLEVKFKLSREYGPVETTERISVQLNDDHIIVILDKAQTILDVYSPFKMDSSKAVVDLNVTTEILRLFVPVIWSVRVMHESFELMLASSPQAPNDDLI